METLCLDGSGKPSHRYRAWERQEQGDDVLICFEKIVPGHCKEIATGLVYLGALMRIGATEIIEFNMAKTRDKI